MAPAACDSETADIEIVGAEMIQTEARSLHPLGATASSREGALSRFHRIFTSLETTPVDRISPPLMTRERQAQRLMKRLTLVRALLTEMETDCTEWGTKADLRRTLLVLTLLQPLRKH